MADTMLVIDDEDIVLESCRRIFSAEGFQVTCTTSPREGLRLVENSSFDVILCDWKMPGFDGMDVLAELNQRSPDSAVIMISGYPTVGRATEAMDRGAMAYVPKPFTPDEIVMAVKNALKHRAI
jgi:DNA-binding NtrC family response regulator